MISSEIESMSPNFRIQIDSSGTHSILTKQMLMTTKMTSMAENKQIYGRKDIHIYVDMDLYTISFRTPRHM